MFDFMLIAAVQITLESLPVSSSAHVLLVQTIWERLVGHGLQVPPDFFNDFIQGPTIVVLLLVFLKDWFFSARRLIVSGWDFLLFRNLRWSERRLWSIFGKLVLFVWCADSITVLAYGLRYKLGTSGFFVPSPWVLVIDFTLSMGGLLSLYFINPKRNNKPLSVSKSLALGFAQGAALLLPGLSRFGSTYVVGSWLQLSPRRAFQFSFLIQFPLIFGAFVIKGLPGVTREFLTLPFMGVLLGSTIIAGLLFAWAYRLACTRKLWWFGLYMIVPITILIWLILNPV